METPPYDTAIWGRLCFGGPEADIFEPQSSPTNAQQAIELMPPGTRFRALVREVSEATSPLWGFQVCDASHQKRLSAERRLYPTLWARFDASSPNADLASYTTLLAYGTLEITPHEVHQAAEVVVLVSPDNQPLEASELPLVARRI